MNLFRKLQLELHIFLQYLTPHPNPETRRQQNHPRSQAHPSYSHAQQFPSVNVFSRTDT